MDIGDVHLNNRCRDSADGVLQGDGRVGVSTCVQHDTVHVEAHFLYIVDKLALDVGWEIIETHVRITAFQPD